MTYGTAVKDPVCGMDIDTAAAAVTNTYNGRAYYFCGHTCEQRFLSTPELYLGKKVAATAGSAN
jgi:YHS domain-containing protein